jgi:hydrogenase maturation protease
MTEATGKVLVIGYGNPGRLDDGLGPALAARLEALALPGVTVDADYQLTVEDAATVAAHDVVVLVDADTSGAEPFHFDRLAPTPGLGFSSHSVSPGALLALAEDLFGARPEAWVLGIRGYDFNEFGERISERAQANLDAATAFVVATLRSRAFRTAPADPARSVETDEGGKR